MNKSGQEVVRGLVNDTSQEIKKIMGQSSNKNESLPGYIDAKEIIHRENLVVK